MIWMLVAGTVVLVQALVLLFLKNANSVPTPQAPAPSPNHPSLAYQRRHLSLIVDNDKKVMP